MQSRHYQNRSILWIISVPAVLASLALAGCRKQPNAENNASQNSGARETSSPAVGASGRAYFAKDVIAAWEQAGARTGWIRTDLEGNLWFREGTATHYGNGPLLDDDIPAFEFEVWPQNGLAGLSVPGIDFGLDLTSTRVTDEQFGDVARFQNLVALDLENTNTADAGAQTLAVLPQLRYLNLHNADLTDAGLASLAQIQSLRYLQVIGMRVQRSTIYQVQNALPKCMMYYR